MVAVYTLGTALIDLGRVKITPTSPRQFALLLRLSAEPGRRVSRSILHQLIFPDQTEANGRHSLRELAYKLRRTGLAIESVSDTISLASEHVEIDSVSLISCEKPDSKQLKAAEDGFLPGYNPAFSESFTDWLEGYRTRTVFDLCGAFLRLARRARVGNDWTMMQRAARACLALDPLNEEATLVSAESMAACGAKIQAVKLLDRYIEEVGGASRDLRIPAAVLRRRISDHDAAKFYSPGAAKFVGREVQTAKLRRMLSMAQRSETQCAVLSGEPGIGKSRLLLEFCTAAALEGAAVVLGSTHPNDSYRPFGVFADVLERLLALPGALGCAPEALEILERLRRGRNVDPSLARALTTDGESLCESIIDSIVELVDAITSEQCLVLAIEDAHWLDQMSLRVLTCLASRRPPRPILVALTTRHLNSIGAFLQFADSVNTMEIGGLDDRSILEMTSALADVNDAPVDAEMRDWLTKAANGSPLFLELLFAHFAETGERFTIPPTLASLVSRRVEALSANAATTLRVCAFLGKHSTLGTIVAAVDLPRFALLRALAELEAARLIKSEGQRILPVHGLISDIVERTTPSVAKRFAHQCAATALEAQLTTSQSTGLLWDCAQHWIAAQVSPKSLEAIRRCAAHAVDIGRPAEAAEVLSWGLTLDLNRADQVELARQLISAADAASEHSLVFRGLDVLRLNSVPFEHDDIEFAEFRACARSWYEAPDQEERLMTCVSSADASANHRVLAATWLLKHADVQHKPALAMRAVSALDESVICAAGEACRLEFLLIRDCTLGELDRAAITARRLLEAAQTTAPEVRSGLRLNAALAFQRCGLENEAIAAATTLYFDADSAGMQAVRARAAAYAAELYFIEGHDEQAREWFDRVANLAKHTSDLARDFAPAVARLSYLLTRRDVAEARDLFDRLEKGGLFSSGAVRSRWRTAFRARLSQLERPEEPLPDFSHIVDDSDPDGWVINIIDFETATACYERLRTSGASAARQQLDQYLATRHRTRTKLSRCLRDVHDAIDRHPANTEQCTTLRSANCAKTVRTNA